ncbi:TatD family hydrolase [Corynebacterium pygosceleis]|uniref:TatD family hydrolase n=1 Tax=Corynebacterium pygosceleis TaxID=2800406 RepID=UPI0019034479|nr:TatD family hydrolase [Corynebacterium pygosceleis]MCL0120804.1 TatD family hydrolase [Corynebacterium pygosceleis]
MAKNKKPRPTPVPADRVAGLVDAHTHLASCGARTPEEIDAIVARAVDAGVEKLCTVGDGLEEACAALEAANTHERVYAACAVHPTRADQMDDVVRARLTEMARDPRCVAIGETGLDAYWITRSDTCASMDAQEEALRWHIDLAVSSGRTLMIHNREADADLLRILADSPAPREVMLHCFSSPLDVAEEALSRGYVLSFSGNVTFNANDHLREAARIAPAGQLLVETDAPYMTPVPYRGSKNEPALIGHSYARIAQIRGVDVRELADEVNATFDRVYGLDLPA